MFVSSIFSAGSRGCGGGEREHRKHHGEHHGGGDWYERSYRSEGDYERHGNRRDREEFLEIAGIGIL